MTQKLKINIKNLPKLKMLHISLIFVKNFSNFFEKSNMYKSY